MGFESGRRTRRTEGVSSNPSLKAGEGSLQVQGQADRERGDSPLLSLFVLSRPPVDGVRLIHTGNGALCSSV